MIFLSNMEEQYLQLFLDNVRGENYVVKLDASYLDIFRSINKTNNLTLKKDLDTLYDKGIFSIKPVVCISGEVSVALSEFSFKYFKLKDTILASYFNLSFSEYQILKYLIEIIDEDGSFDVNEIELGKLFSMSDSSVDYILKKLESIGYLQLIGGVDLDCRISGNLISYYFKDKMVALDSLIYETNNIIDSLNKNSNIDSEIELLINGVENLRNVILDSSHKTEEEINELKSFLKSNNSKFDKYLGNSGSIASLIGLIPTLLSF